MLGILRDTPSTGNSAVNKDYVDGLVSAGTTPTGSAGGDLGGTYPLNVSGISSFTGIATFSDVIDLNANRITDVGTPTASSDAATKGYVDGLVGTGTIGTTNLADDSVTYAKIQDVTATNRLLGRASAGAGIVEEITLGT